MFARRSTRIAHILMFVAVICGVAAPFLSPRSAMAQPLEPSKPASSRLASLGTTPALAKFASVARMAVPVSSKESARFASLALHHPRLADFDGIFGAELSVRTDEPRVFATEATLGVMFPVRGGESQSTYSLWFDRATGAFLEDVAVVGQRVGESDVRTRVALNGVVTMDEVVANGTRLQFLGNGCSLAATGGEPDVNWGCVNRCLSEMGIAAWLIAAAGTMCSAFCVVTTPVGCAACIGVVSAALIWQAWTCASRCNY